LASKAIHVRHSKSGRSRSVPLADEGVEFFRKAVEDKTDGDRLFEPVSTYRAACERRAVLRRSHRPPHFTICDGAVDDGHAY
jgi:hypothetical protein